MKKFAILFVMSAFLLSGALLNSCKKDELQNTSSTPVEKPMLKDVVFEECTLPLMMGQTTYIGCVDIYYSLGFVYINVDLNDDLDGFNVTESHLYYGPAIPTMWQPGKFPYALDDNYAWSIAENYGCCEGFYRYIALHLQLEKIVMEPVFDELGNPVLDENGDQVYEPVTYEETAWLIPADESGVPFKNKKGQLVGWGQYFKLTFQVLPEITSLDLLWSSTVQTEWTSADPGFEMCLDGDVTYYYLDADLEVSCPLEATMNPFDLDPVTDEQFWADWDAKGVNESAAEPDWQYYMWKIINGDLPMFYVKVVGGEETLIDGLMFAFYGVEMTLQINGDYTPGTYGFTGLLKGSECDGAPFTINLTVSPCD